MELLLIVGSGVLGLLLGSFANVVIHRVPEKASIVSPPSACPACGARVRPHDNVPVVSWLLLRGRCRDCQAAIAWRYPAIELLTGVLFAAVAGRVGLDWGLPGLLLFAWTLIVLAAIDARTRRIPNAITYPLTPVLLVLLAVAAFAEGEPWLAARALLGGLAAGASLLALAIISPRGMGMGDVKLAAFIGVGLGYLGWAHVVVGVFGGFLLGGVSALGLLALGRRGRKDLIPFGPFLAAGAFAALLWGPSLVAWYLDTAGIAGG
jgi:leader peptidase (prepilin peptidase)/N-methyltransferase